MNPATNIRKWGLPQTWKARGLCLLATLSLGLLPDKGFAANTDLPYSSPSTGADGALVISDTLPFFVRSEYPVQLAYDANNGYLIALGTDTEFSKNMLTYGLIEGEWVRLASNINVSETVVTYDGARDEIIRFGSVQPSTNFYTSGLYRWNGSGWESIAIPDNVRPSARSAAAMTFDAIRNEVVVFGGQNYIDGEFNDTWAWNGTSWTNKTPLAPETSPPKRIWGSMAFDAARGEVVLFGGEYENDTWTWNGTTWTQKFPANVPPDRKSSSMAYDPVRQLIVLCLTGNGGNLETWEWDGANWTKRATTSDPGEREFHGVVYNPEASAIQLHNGEFPNGSTRNADSWAWDGANWSLLTVSPYLFDMTPKPDGIWNFTTIDVGTTEVKFIKNAANSPVVWLATGEVHIDGHLNMDGTQGYQGYVSSTEPYNTPAPGGSGGFDGGLGGYYENATGTNVAGFPGMGPAGGMPSLPGGAAGNQDGFHGTHYTVYNSASLQAPSGGSGGGGAASSYYAAFIEWGRGGNGGGGGGSILIASSRDIWIDGSITAKGGEGRYEFYKGLNDSYLSTGTSHGGSGSGGSIRLVGDRVLSSGLIRLDVSSAIISNHDRKKASENRGRIRIESYFHKDVASISNSNDHVSYSAPRTTLLASSAPTLNLVSIAGQPVSLNPSSDPASPEVTFSSAGDVTISISAQNVPEGSTINLSVSSGSELITATPKPLAGGTVDFLVTVPAGKGFVQAWVNWEVTP